MREGAFAELGGQPLRPDFEPELRTNVPAYIPEAYVSDENERVVLYRRVARGQNEADVGEIRDEMRDRFGPVPTLIENLIAAMNVRRQMKQLMILSAILKGSQLEIRFHPDAPVETARLAKLADQNRRTMRLTPSYQLIARIEPGDYVQLFAQLDAILHALAGCEKLDNWQAAKVGPVVN